MRGEKRRRSIGRAMGAAAAGLALLLALAALAIGVTLGTEAGTRWSLRELTRLLPALDIEQAQGTWWRGIEVSVLSWRDETLQLQARGLALRTSLPALLLGTARIDTLRAQQVRVELPAAADAEADAVTELPNLFLPFGLSLPSVRVEKLDLVDGDSTVTLRRAALDARWRGDSVTIEDFSIAWEEGRAWLSGSLTLAGDYPLEVEGGLQHGALPGELSARLRGSVRALEVEATLGGAWALRARGQLHPLEPGLPLSLALATRDAVAVQAAGETVRIPAAGLTVSGTLDRLAGDLRLQLDERRYGRSDLSTEVLWHEGRLALADARWQLADGRTPLSADCALTPGEQHWTCEGRLQALPLAPWLPDRRGSLSSPWRASGSFRQAPTLELALADIRGELDNASLSGRLHLATDGGERWRLHRLELTAGDNRLSADGVLGGDSAVHVKGQLARLAQLHPPLQGRAEFAATVRGALTAPDIEASLDARDLVYGDWRTARLMGELRLPQLGRQPGRLRLALTEAAAGDTRLSGVLEGSGDRAGQRWQLLLDEAGGSNLVLHCEHSADERLSRGRLRCERLDGHLALRQHRVPLALTQPLTVDWRQSGPTIDVQPFCLRADEARLCLTTPTDLDPTPEAPAELTLSELPLQWLGPYAPRPVDLQPGATVQARVLVLQRQPLTANARLQVPSVAWQWPGGETPATATLEAVTAEVDIRENSLALRAGARSDDLGELALTATVDDPAGSRSLDGQLQIRQLRTSAFSWLYPEDYGLTGRLDAELQLAGTLANPELGGTATLSDGSVVLPALEEPLRDVALQLRLEHRRARFDGRFRLGEGTGDLSGALTVPEQWQQWQLRAELATRGVRFSPLPDSSLTLSSALALDADAADIRLTGDINVERADIRILQLPPDTQRVSPDAEIVGGEPDTGPQLYADVQLNLGEKFHFTGFGADVYLAGNLQVRQRPDSSLSTRGEVRITEGRYRAYGQRLTVRRGSFLFNGPPDNPDIDLRAVREMPPDADITVGVDVTGTLRYPLATLFSEPPMPDTEAAYYLLTGKPPPTAGQASQLSAESALLSIGVAGASERAAGVAEKIGISDFQLSAGGGEQGTEAQVSGYLSPRLYVRYGTGLQEGANSVTFQYRVTRQLILEAVTGVNQALDVLYSFDIE